MKEVFVADIKHSGIKIFNYSLTRIAAQASGNGKHGGSGKGAGKHGSGRGMGGGKSVNETSMKPYFYEMLESKLKESGYCREDYFEIDSYFGRGQLQMRGECEEGATSVTIRAFIHILVIYWDS